MLRTCRLSFLALLLIACWTAWPAFAQKPQGPSPAHRSPELDKLTRTVEQHDRFLERLTAQVDDVEQSANASVTSSQLVILFVGLMAVLLAFTLTILGLFGYRALNDARSQAYASYEAANRSKIEASESEAEARRMLAEMQEIAQKIKEFARSIKPPSQPGA